MGNHGNQANEFGFGALRFEGEAAKAAERRRQREVNYRREEERIDERLRGATAFWYVDSAGARTRRADVAIGEDVRAAFLAAALRARPGEEWIEIDGPPVPGVYRKLAVDVFPFVVEVEVTLGERDGGAWVASGQITLTRDATGALRHGQPDDAERWISAPLLRAMREATGVDPGYRCAAFDELCRQVGKDALASVSS